MLGQACTTQLFSASVPRGVWIQTLNLMTTIKGYYWLCYCCWPKVTACYASHYGHKILKYFLKYSSIKYGSWGLDFSESYFIINDDIHLHVHFSMHFCNLFIHCLNISIMKWQKSQRTKWNQVKGILLTQLSSYKSFKWYANLNSSSTVWITLHFVGLGTFTRRGGLWSYTTRPTEMFS